ncbi:MAG: ChaN family lipoprotein [Oligoflexales bacterium]|nr:ChaN family lipoprotein [Oligoflexales bacterium]
MNKKDRLLALQYSLYERIRNRIYNITGPDSEEILEYEHSFLSSLPDAHSDGSVSEFRNDLESSPFVLVGDFHALPSNQQDYLDLLNYLYFNKNKKKLVVALECFSIDDQDPIDSYLLGEIDEKEFLTLSGYAKNWGFPWDPIKKILDFARNQNLPVVGVNVGRGESFSLSQRDYVFAKHLLKAIKKYEGYQLIYLVGEHHLSTDHLPKQIVENSGGEYLYEDLMVILSNTDKYYFASLEEASEKPSTLFKLGKRNYCILDTPPWGKWLSYLVWQEHCDTCVHPWIKYGEEQFAYDTDDYFLECFNFFQKYFGEGESYPALCNLFNRIIAVEEGYFKGHEMENTWGFKRFQHFDSAYFPDKKIIYWRPLSWRGIISAIAQCLAFKPVANNLTSEQTRFNENVNACLAYYSFESIFNPVGFLNQSWIKKVLFGQGSSFLLNENRPGSKYFSSHFHPYLFSHGIGQSLANLLNKGFQNEEKCYAHLHKILKSDELIGLSFMPEIDKLQRKKQA